MIKTLVMIGNDYGDRGDYLRLLMITMIVPLVMIRNDYDDRDKYC